VSLWPTVGLGVVLAWSLLLIAAQPVRSPWWTYADADAVYVGTALNLTYGNSHARYLDHPGLPLHEVLATSFELERLAERVVGRGRSETEFFNAKMLDLDAARALFRGWGIAFYLLGAALSYVLAARLLGHWLWGLAAGLAWTAAPGLVAMSIQYRADVPLAVLVLVTGFLIVRAAQRRSVLVYVAAAFALGFAVMVKLHAAGLVVPLLLAALWRPPVGDRWRRSVRELSRLSRPSKALLLGGVFLWFALIVVFDRPRVPFDVTEEQRSLIVNTASVLGIYAVTSWIVRRTQAFASLRRVFDPFLAVLAGAVILGMLVPAAVVAPDGVQAAVVVWRGVTGRGINEEIEPFTADFGQLLEFPLAGATLMFFVAAVAAVVGVRRRDPTPVLLFAGAASLALMAQARLATTHYFAPAFVLSVPAALWLFRERGGPRPSLLVWPVIAFLVVPQFTHRHDAEQATTKFAAREGPAMRAAASRLTAQEVALVPGAWPHPDARYFEFVRAYVEHTPERRYRVLPDIPTAAAYLTERGLRPRYFTGPAAAGIVDVGPLALQIGTFEARRVPDIPNTVELLSVVR
jgi:hypothetical protein